MEKQNRSPFLSALCILTFIGSGVAFLGYFMLALFFDNASKFIISIGNIKSMDGIKPWCFLLFMVLYAFSLVGAIRIWKLRRDGYFIYLIAQTLIVFLPVFQLGWASFYFTNAIFTFVFIVGYSFHLRMLK